MPFLTTVAHGTASYDSAMTDVHHNFIMANYGAAQGFDTDDGSAWFNIVSNLNWDALGYKNDYGGYNVKYARNVNVCWGGKCNGNACWNIGPTQYAGPSNAVFENKCIVFGSDSAQSAIAHIAYPTSRKGSALRMHNNSYYTESANALLAMANASYDSNLFNVSEMQREFGLEMGSVSAGIPSNAQIIEWARETLGML